MLKLQTRPQLEAGRLKRSFTLVMLQAAKQIPNALTIDLIETISPTVPHIEEVVLYHDQWLANDELIEPFTKLGVFYQGQSNYAQAKFWYALCLEIVTLRCGDKHLSVAISSHNLAGLYRERGQYAEAEPLLITALEINEHQLGKDHLDVANCLSGLAEIHKVRGRYQEAESHLLRSLEIREQQLGTNHLLVGQCFNDLAEIYRIRNRYDEAETLYLQSLAIHHQL
jgi:tetratricopeptide (TPR) repeat protein